MYSSPLLDSSFNRSLNDSVFNKSSAAQDGESKQAGFLFGAKRRSMAISQTPSFLSPAAGPSAPSTDIFASPAPPTGIPSHVKESTAASGKSVHWSPSVLNQRDKSQLSSPIIRPSAVHGPPSHAPPLRSIRDEMEPVPKIARRSMNLAPVASPANITTSPGLEEESAADCWVTIFGFAPEQAATVLKFFSRHGEIVTHKIPTRGNWMHVRYSCDIHAKQALSHNGRVIDGVVRIGAVPCVEKDIVGEVDPYRSSNRSMMCTNLSMSIREEPENDDTVPSITNQDLNTSTLDRSIDTSRSASRGGMRSLASGYDFGAKVAQPVKQESLMSKLWGAVGLQ